MQRHGVILTGALALFVSLCAGAQSITTTPVMDGQSSIIQLRQGELSLPVSLTCPRITLDGVTVGGGIGPLSVHGDLSRGETVEATYPLISLADAGSLEVRVRIEWAPQEGVLRKWAALRLAPGSPSRVVEEVVLEDLEVNGKHAHMAPGEVQSYPAFLDGFFAGIEFPVAATRIEHERLLVAHRPGVTLQTGVWCETRRAVFGVAPKGGEKSAFQKYIAARRPQPTGLHVNYNSWWTSPVPYTEPDILTLMASFKDRLYTPYHESFDTFCIDMGWSKARSLWEIDPALFPDGFGRIAEAGQAMGCRLGLWISPSSCYPPALDNAWAAEQGYETFLRPWVGGQPARFACLGGKRYQQAFQERLVDMATRYGVRHFKLDGYLFTCPESDHGHAPGALSAEPIADGLINAAEAVRKAAPDVWFEPTCFGLNPSPWWLFHFNSVIGSFGDDAPYGRVPAPVYRESYTTARDFFNLQGAYWSTLPMAAQEVLGVVHQSPEPFLNDAVMTVMRGQMFLPVYLNPAYMTDERWKSFAALSKWGRLNEELLRETEPLLPASWRDGQCPKFTNDAVMPREPYGYAHWKNPEVRHAVDEGLVVLRNPWIERQSASFVVGGASPNVNGANAKLAVVGVYPEPRIYARGVHVGNTVTIPLAPYETVVLSVQSARPRRGISSAAKALGPAVRVSHRDSHLERIEFEGSAEKFGPDWTCPLADAASGVQLRLDAAVDVAAPQAELLVLYEDRAHPAGLACTITINGAVAPVEVSDSEAGWAATGLPRPEHWVFYRAKLDKGANRVQLDASGAAATGTLSAWVWATKPGPETAADNLDLLPSPKTISLDSVALLAPLDLASGELKTVHASRPVDRINGIYLDALTPASVLQGWGTLQKNQSVWEKPLMIAGKRFDRGLGTHAPSRIVYPLDGTYRRFQCWAGADSATAPTIAFEVYVDGRKRWESGPMDRATPAKQVDLDIAQAQSLELVVSDGGNGLAADHADWADAKLVK